VQPFLQGHSPATTLGRIKKLIEFTEPEQMLFCFAYATASGCAEFQRQVGEDFWDNQQTSWLFGIDYGRTQPAALEFISRKNNASVKIMNGKDVVEAPAFVPTSDFHMKACFVRNVTEHKYGMIVGSGNFSRAGLIANTECGVLLTAGNEQEYETALKRTFDRAWALWDDADDLDNILEAYKARWKSAPFNFPDTEQEGDEEDSEEEATVGFTRWEFDDYRYFWIDAGYVTQNRGPNNPGNQFDLPRGVHNFFGFEAAENQAVNTVIGEIPFILGEETLVRALRLGNNHMEKITMPIPEDYGFGAYDGTIIEFERVENGFRVRTFEPNDYLLAHRQDADLVTYRMGSGRPYGFRGL
jgi:hypothetical protein